MSKKTSWETSSKWYDQLIGPQGHYYHEAVIFPELKRRISAKKNHVLDLGCGSGALLSILPPPCDYTGVDASASLIESAKKKTKGGKFVVADVTGTLSLPQNHFSDAFFILSLQNMADPNKAIANGAKHLKRGGKLFIVLNHPSFRIPRQSGWIIDEKRKVQSRRIDCYMSKQKIPIQTHPGKADSPTTWTFHHPLSTYTKLLQKEGFVIEEIDEWCSDKQSTGKKAAMENRARKEFPLFLFILASKI